ncbi:MAG: tRNA (5-methylaminomethyl-2-thiouridine)(34)-methyltransferase MnmD [Bacteroidetes bacterium]|nr:tRNA (5-methylaminomethyl-2-thiouridine)(34)-methyltransferase MnmD [Bacteroidota bacterium]
MNKLLITTDGSHTLESERYGVSYHSKYGSIQESRHVFLKAALHFAGMGKDHVHVLEAGFGTGLNAFLTYLDSKEFQRPISYTALEAFPVDMDTAAKLNFTEVLGLPEESSAFQRMHTCSWEQPVSFGNTFQLTKRQMQFQEADFKEVFDVVYFDAFAPGAQPELWGPEVLGNMYRALKPGGVLTTYCAKGVVKRQLKALGFTIEALPGPPGKREMTRAVKA